MFPPLAKQGTAAAMLAVLQHLQVQHAMQLAAAPALVEDTCGRPVTLDSTAVLLLRWVPMWV